MGISHEKAALQKGREETREKVTLEKEQERTTSSRSEEAVRNTINSVDRSLGRLLNTEITYGPYSVLSLKKALWNTDQEIRTKKK